MPLRQTHRSINIVEPPRDGEFYFDDVCEEGEDRNVPTLMGYLGRSLGRHPVVWIGSAASIGLLISAVMAR